jgi:hypothetical protein
MEGCGVILTIDKRAKIRTVPDAYDRQYRDRYGEAFLANHSDPYDIYRALKRLNLDICTEADIELIIGNPSWTRLECDHCGEDSPALTTFEGQYEAFSVCAQCLSSAASGMEAATAGETGTGSRDAQ